MERRTRFHVTCNLNPTDLIKVKRKLSHDARYDAVGSSSLREELFNTFVKARASSKVDEATSSQNSMSEPKAVNSSGETEPQRKRLDRKERALKEREDKVREQRGRMEAEIGRSRVDLNQEEGERVFR